MLSYLVWAGCETWLAKSLPELADLFDRALAHDPWATQIRALELRPLTSDEFGEMLRLHSDRSDDNHHEP